MSWSLEFDEPIELNGGSKIATLRDAGHYVAALPRRVAELDHWQTAIACLISASEKTGPVMMARIAVLQALSASTPQPALVRTRAKARNQLKISR